MDASQTSWKCLPCPPVDWKAYTIHYRYREMFYHITVRQISDPAVNQPGVTIDGVQQKDMAIRLLDDRREHKVEMSVAAPQGHQLKDTPALLLR